MYCWSVSGIYDHLGCPHTAAEFLSLRTRMLRSTTVMVSRRVEFTKFIILLCVFHFGMLMESFPSPEIPDCIDFSSPPIRALGDVEVPISAWKSRRCHRLPKCLQTYISLYQLRVPQEYQSVSVLDDWCIGNQNILCQLCDRTRRGSRALSSKITRPKLYFLFRSCRVL